MAGRGRPRKAGQREPSGRPSRRIADHGTPELRARRVALVKGADPALAENPLDVMFALGLITIDQQRSAKVYAWLYTRAVRQPWPPAVHQEMAGGRPSEIDTDDEAEIEHRFRRGKNVLLSAGRRVAEATEALVVFGHFPRFLDPSAKRYRAERRNDRREQDAAVRGLMILANCYRRR